MVFVVIEFLSKRRFNKKIPRTPVVARHFPSCWHAVFHERSSTTPSCRGNQQTGTVLSLFYKCMCEEICRPSLRAKAAETRVLFSKAVGFFDSVSMTNARREMVQICFYFVDCSSGTGPQWWKSLDLFWITFVFLSRQHTSPVNE